jgi:hypothetical protein
MAFPRLEALTPQLHRAPRNPPLGLITAEIQRALASLPRADGTPAHWQPIHGDFAPWNLRRVTSGRLVLINWEDVSWGPPGADEVFYRATQSALGLAAAPATAYEEGVAYGSSRSTGGATASGNEHLAAGMIRALGAMSPVDRIELSTARRPRVIVFAYACEPGRGSEPGAGWGLVRAVSEFADCVVLTAAEHLPGIRRWEAEAPGSSMSFVEVPEPAGRPLRSGIALGGSCSMRYGFAGHMRSVERYMRQRPSMSPTTRPIPSIGWPVPWRASAYRPSGVPSAGQSRRRSRSGRFSAGPVSSTRFSTS